MNESWANPTFMAWVNVAALPLLAWLHYLLISRLAPPRVGVLASLAEVDTSKDGMLLKLVVQSLQFDDHIHDLRVSLRLEGIGRFSHREIQVFAGTTADDAHVFLHSAMERQLQIRLGRLRRLKAVVIHVPIDGHAHRCFGEVTGPNRPLGVLLPGLFSGLHQLETRALGGEFSFPWETHFLPASSTRVRRATDEPRKLFRRDEATMLLLVMLISSLAYGVMTSGLSLVGVFEPAPLVTHIPMIVAVNLSVYLCSRVLQAPVPTVAQGYLKGVPIRERLPDDRG